MEWEERKDKMNIKIIIYILVRKYLFIERKVCILPGACIIPRGCTWMIRVEGMER